MGGESRREALVEMERAVAFEVKNEAYILKTDTNWFRNNLIYCV